MENKVDIKVDLLITRDAKEGSGGAWERKRERKNETNIKTLQKDVQFMRKPKRIEVIAKYYKVATEKKSFLSETSKTLPFKYHTYSLCCFPISSGVIIRNWFLRNLITIVRQVWRNKVGDTFSISSIAFDRYYMVFFLRGCC